MTDATTPVPGVAWEGESEGVEWHLELDRRVLLPGRLVNGRVRLVSLRGNQARALLVTLRAEEHWRHRETHTDAQGHTSTRVVTSTADAAREPVQLREAVHLSAGETLDLPFQLPVPPLGPASLAAEDAGVTWSVEAKLDVEGSFDSGIEHEIVVAQPTALLRAGVVHLAEQALYDSVDVAADGVTASIVLSPTPLVCGAPFHGEVRLHAASALRLQEVRAEVRVHVAATVTQGESADVTAWTAIIAQAGEVSGDVVYAIDGVLPPTPLPSIELPHGRTDATFHLILARAWAPDSHLVRDVAIATTAEL